MKVPQFFSELLQKLVDKLYALLPESSRPTNKSFIAKEKISQDPDVQRVQSFYNLFLWIQTNVIPRIKEYDKEEDLKEYLNWVLAFIGTQEWGRVVLNSVSQSLLSTGNFSLSQPSSSSSSSSSQTVTYQLSENPETEFLKQLCDIASVIVNEMAPAATASASTSKVNIKKIIHNLISNWGEAIKDKNLPLITAQFHKVLLERHCSIPELGKVITRDQLSKEGGTQLVQLLYNVVFLGLERILSLSKQLASKEAIAAEDIIQYSAEETKFFLTETSPFLEQINVLFLDEIWQLLPEKNRPAKKRTFILEEQMGPNLGTKLVQTGYNLACAILHQIIPDIQKQEWKSITDLIGNPLTFKSGYAIKPIKLLLTHLNPLNEQLKISFIDTVWNSLPEGDRLSKREMIPKGKISQNPKIQMQQCFYNVACFLLNEVFPKMQEYDSLVGLGMYLLGQIPFLLKHLRPFINQMKRILIDEAYQALPPEARSKTPGKMISEEGEKFSQDTHTRFMQITYDCACLLFNKILPEIEGSKTAAGVLKEILYPGESFEDMIRLMNDIGFHFNYQKEEFFNSGTNNNLVINDEKTIFSFIGEKLFPLLMGVLKVLAPVEAKILPLVSQIKDLLEPVTQSFVSSVEKFLEPIKPQLVKSKTDLFEPSINLLNAFYALFNKGYELVSSRTMVGNLSYQAACIIYETSNDLMNQLISLYQTETESATKKEYELLYNYFVILIPIIQWEIKEERAFIPLVVREFIPRMNALKNEVSQLTAELNSLYGDGLKPDSCEQYLASMNAIEARKNKHYSEFQDLMAEAKTLAGVKDQKVITYESKPSSGETTAQPQPQGVGVTTQSTSSNTETTTQNESHVKPVLLKFSSFEVEAVKNVWRPLFTLIEARRQEVKKLQENNAYLSQVYQKVYAENFKVIKDFLAEQIPSVYHFGYHQKLFSICQQLKKVKLDEALLDRLPHPEFKTAYREEIKRYNVLLENEYQDFVAQLNANLIQKKAYFNRLVVEALTKKISTLKTESQQKLASITRLFLEIALKNPEPTKLSTYEKQVEFIKVWLAEIQPDAVINAALKEKGLTNFECVNSWLIDFAKTESYQQYTLKVKDFTKTLTETIAEQDAKLKLASGQQVDKLETEIIQLKKQLLDCESNLETIIDAIKLTCCVDTNQELQLDAEKRKLIEQISSSAKMLHLPELSMTCTLLDTGVLSTQINKKLAEFTEIAKKQASSSSSKTPIRSLYNQVNSANTFQEFEKITDTVVKKVQESMDPLSGGSLASCIANLKDDVDIQKNKQEAMKLLAGFLPAISPEKVVSSNTMDEKKLCNILQELISKLEAVLMQEPIYHKLSTEHATTKNEVTLKTIQIKLTQLKTVLTDAREGISALFEKFKVADEKLEKETVGVFSLEEVCEKNIARQSLLSSWLSEIKTFQANVSTSIVAILSKIPNEYAIQAIPSVKKMLTDELLDISKHCDELDAEVKIKVTEIENENRMLLAEQKAIPNYSTTLKNADELVKNLCKINAAIQTHEYDEQTVNALKQATFLNPSGILKEDKFYEDIEFIIANFRAELKQLNEVSLPSSSSLRLSRFARNDGENGGRESLLENAFNKALNQKIEEAKAALTQTQTNYERLKKEWESLAVQYPIIKNLRALSKNFKGAKLEQCTSINFKGVILDKNTEIDWESNSENILLDNFSNPLFKPPQVNYFSNLIATVKSKTPICGIRGKWVLAILKEIGGHTSFRPWTHANKMDLMTQQNHAVSVIKQLVPQMDSIQEVLKLKDLVDKKYHVREIFESINEIREKNDYAFIRRELDSFRFKYGNTQPWKEIIQTIQTRLNELAVEIVLKKDSLTPEELEKVTLKPEEYKAGERIMKTHVEHDYGFGFFYTPSVPSQWEALKPNMIPTTQPTC